MPKNIVTPKTNSPLFDLTSMLAVESFFREGLKDPWCDAIVTKFTDLYVFCDNARFTAPVFEEVGETTERSDTFRVLNRLMKFERGLFQPISYKTDEQIELSTEYMSSSFEAFAKWAVANKTTLRRWIAFHRQGWIRGTHDQRFKTNYLYPTQKLKGGTQFDLTQRVLDIPHDEICYAFDLVLRYSLIGRLAGDGQHYLAHPIREEQMLPTMEREPGELPNIPVHIGKAASRFIKKLSLDEYAAFLHEARQIVREMGLNNLKPHTIEKETLAELAAKIWLPPKIRAWDKAYGVVSGMICGIGAYPALGSTSAALGGMISIASLFWSGYLPRSAARLKWLRWAYEWELEKDSRPIE